MKRKAACLLTVTAASDCPLIVLLRPRSGQTQWLISDRYDLALWVENLAQSLAFFKQPGVFCAIGQTPAARGMVNVPANRKKRS